MREIKFRAWHKEEKRMSEPFELGEDIIYDTNNNYLGTIYDELAIMQYTGLKDKNGREIYEGDICRLWYPDGYKLGVVEFKNGCFYWNSNSVGFWNEELEVIGNIYENPELLEEVANGKA